MVVGKEKMGTEDPFLKALEALMLLDNLDLSQSLLDSNPKLREFIDRVSDAAGRVLDEEIKRSENT